MDQHITNILLTCLGYANEATKAEQVAHLSPEDWRAVAVLAEQHGVAPLLHYRLRQLGMAPPSAVAETLKQAYQESVVRNMRLYQQLCKLLRLLREKNIAVIVLKGAYLAEAVYDDIGLRPMGDVDLLVKKDDLLRVEQELLALGSIPKEYNRVLAQDNHHFVYELPRTNLRVEIHWTVFLPNNSFQINLDGLWNRAQPVTLVQTSTLALSPEDLLLHLCLHTAKHAHQMRVRMLCDIGEVVQRFGAELDWQEMGARARQWGTVHAVYAVLRLAQELLEVAVPADWLTSLQPDSFDRRYLELAREQILADHNRMKGAGISSPHLAQLQGPKGLGVKLKLILGGLFPSRENMARMYPAPANSWRIFLYYPARILFVLTRYGKTLWQLMHDDPKTKAAAEHTNEVTALRDWLISG